MTYLIYQINTNHTGNVTIGMPKNLITFRMSVTYEATYNIHSIIVNETIHGTASFAWWHYNLCTFVNLQA